MLESAYRLLEGPSESRIALGLRLAIQALILANVGAAIVATVEPIGSKYGGALDRFEEISLVLFTIEYLTRIASCTQDPAYRGPIKGRLRFATTPLAIVDLLAIAPLWAPFLGLDLRALRALRLIRVFRILKLGRYSKAVQSLGRALLTKLPELAVVAFALMIILVLASSVMYYAERDAQPGVFSSIPAAAWWGIATLTTVGYGDITPITAVGKLAASVFALLGIGLFALPAGILGSAFVAQLGQDETAKCPHYGHDL